MQRRNGSNSIAWRVLVAFLLFLPLMLPGPVTAQVTPVRGALNPTVLVGVWRDRAQSRPFVISRANEVDPAASNKIELRTLDKGNQGARIWLGSFDPSDKPVTARLWVQYTPSAEDLDADALPAWVRKAVVGKGLVWHLLIDEIPACGAEDKLKAKWVPGRVEWSDDGREDPDSVKVLDLDKPVGQRAAVDLELIRDDAVEVEVTGRTAIEISVGGVGGVDRPQPLYLIRQEKIRVNVTLTRQAAKTQGESLDVSFRGLKNGQVVKKSLSASPAPDSFAGVRYTSRDAIEIDDLDRLISEDGAAIEASFGEARQVVQVFYSDYSRGLRRLADAIGAFEITFADLLSAPGISHEQREDARQRLRLIANAKKWVDSGDYTFETRYAAVSAYLSPDGGSGLVVDRPQRWYGETEVKSPHGFYYASEQEFWALDWQPTVGGYASPSIDPSFKGPFGVVARAREHARTELLKSTVFAVYDIVAVTTRGSDVSIVVSGVDHNGRRVDTAERLRSVFELFLAMTPAGQASLAERLYKYAASSRLGRRVLDVVEFAPPIGGALPTGPANKRRLRSGFPTMLERIVEKDLCAAQERALNLARAGDLTQYGYTSTFKLAKDGAVPKFGQLGATLSERIDCQIASYAYARYLETGLEHDLSGLHAYLSLEEALGNKGWSRSGTLGASDEIIAKLTTATGGVADSRHLEPYEIVALHDRGIRMKLVVEWPGAKGRHAIVLNSIERDAQNNISKITHFDPAVMDPISGKAGHLVETDRPCDFWGLILQANPNDIPNAQALMWTAAGKKIVK